MLATRRYEVISEHIAAKSAHDLDRALATFHRAHYHVFPLSIDAPGEDALRGLPDAVFTAFPDFQFVADALVAR